MSHDRAEGTSQRCGNPSAISITEDFTDPSILPDSKSVLELQEEAYDRGFEDAKTNAARFFLERVGYQHASEYFEFCENANRMSLGYLHRVIMFDRSLQSLLMEYICLVEFQLRTQYSQSMLEMCGPFAHRHAENFKSRSKFSSFINIYKSEYKAQVRAHNSMAVRNYERYRDVPIWQAVEFMSLGTLSMLYKNTRSNAVRRRVSDSFGVSAEILESWLHSLSSLRNRCAHFNRVIGKPLVIRPKKVAEIEGDNSKLFYLLRALIELLGTDVVFSVDGTLHYSASLVVEIANLFYRYDDVIRESDIPNDWYSHIIANEISGISCNRLPSKEEMGDMGFALRLVDDMDHTRSVVLGPPVSRFLTKIDGSK